MFINKYLRSVTVQRCNYLNNFRLKSSTALDIEKIEKDSTDLEVIDEEAQLKEEEIQRKRNKSRLTPHHRNIVNNKPPYEEPVFWTHGTLKYQRKLYGKYGQASGVNPSLCWPTKQELEDKMEYEKVAFPYTIQEMVEECKRKKLEKQESIKQRQEDIEKKIQKLDMWSKELLERAAKKEAEARAVKEKKEKLIEDVRRHFGYTVDPRDDRFKEMLEKKEKEQKKALKDAKKKAKEEKLISKLQQIKIEETTPSAETGDNKQ